MNKITVYKHGIDSKKQLVFSFVFRNALMADKPHPIKIKSLKIETILYISLFLKAKLSGKVMI